MMESMLERLDALGSPPLPSLYDRRITSVNRLAAVISSSSSAAAAQPLSWFGSAADVGRYSSS